MGDAPGKELEMTELKLRHGPAKQSKSPKGVLSYEVAGTVSAGPDQLALYVGVLSSSGSRRSAKIGLSPIKSELTGISGEFMIEQQPDKLVLTLSISLSKGNEDKLFAGDAGVV